MAKKLPTIRTQEDLIPYLKRWQRHLDPVIARPSRLPAPWNFTATKKRGGILLSWEKTAGADGYEILRSDTADFGTYIVIPIESGIQTAYFDSLGGSPTTRSYKIRATSGTQSAPHAAKGALSGLVTATSIDSTDTTTPETTVRDTFTSDSTRALCVSQGTFIVPLGAVLRREEAVGEEWHFIELENGLTLLASPNHQIYTEARLLPVRQVEVGTKVVTFFGLAKVVASVPRAEKRGKIVLSVAGQLFWANWILSHNLKAERLL